MTFLAGVDGFVASAAGGVFKAARAFFGGDIYRFEENLEPKFFVLFHHLR